MTARRGVTALEVIVHAVGPWHHIMLVKLVSLTQDWSTLMIFLPESKRSIITLAYCYRRTRQRSELLWIGTLNALLYTRPSSCFMTCLTYCLLTSTSCFALASYWIYKAFLMATDF